MRCARSASSFPSCERGKPISIIRCPSPSAFPVTKTTPYRPRTLIRLSAGCVIELDRADRAPTLVTEARASRLKEKLVAAKAHVEKLQQVGKQLKTAPGHQISLTDPDARSMATSGRGTGVVGYNVQIAVDSEHHMIVAHEVTNVGHDRAALHAMAALARDAVGEAELIAVADRGLLQRCGDRGLRGRWDTDATAEDADLGQSGAGTVWETGLSLYP